MAVNDELKEWFKKEIIDADKGYEQLLKVEETHEKMKGCYNFYSISPASARRNYEEKNSNYTKIKLKNGGYIEIDQPVSCSCAHVYYYMSIDIHGFEGECGMYSIKLIRDLMNSLEEKQAVLA